LRWRPAAIDRQILGKARFSQRRHAARCSQRPEIDSNMKTALIAGITGQGGSYLAEFLLARGYQVHGIKRRNSLLSTERVDNLYEDPHIPDRSFFCTTVT
jgi:hypothetical protein